MSTVLDNIMIMLSIPLINRPLCFISIQCCAQAYEAFWFRTFSGVMVYSVLYFAVRTDSCASMVFCFSVVSTVKHLPRPHLLWWLLWIKFNILIRLHVLLPFSEVYQISPAAYKSQSHYILRFGIITFNQVASKTFLYYFILLLI